MRATAENAARNEVADFVAAIKAHENYVLRRPGGKRANLRFIRIPGVYLGHRHLEEIDFSGANLKGANLEETNLSRASLSCSDLSDANLAGAILNQADLRGARVEGANFDNAQMERADFRQATIARMDQDMNWSVIGGNQSLASVSFANCSLKGAKLNNANLKDANFDGALLNGASFRGATLGNASFDGAVLIGVKLSDICVTKDRLKNCVTEPGPELHKFLPELIALLDASERWTETSGRQGRCANLEGRDIRLLAEATNNRRLARINCAKTIAVGADFSGCELQAANFDNADLRGAAFVGADLRGASFRGANLAHADFSRTNLLPLALRSGGVMPTAFDGAALNRCNFNGAQRVQTPSRPQTVFLL